MKDPPRQPGVYQFKIVRQIVREPGLAINSSKDMHEHFGFMEQYDREHLLRVDLSNGNEMLGYESVSVGTDSASIVGPKEIFRGALISGASSIILMHNHPSGLVKPSPEDKQTAEKLWRLGEQLELKLLDFVIIGRGGSYYSFTENDLFREVNS